MGDQGQGSRSGRRTSKGVSGSDAGRDDSALGLRAAGFGVPGLKDPKYQDVEDEGPGSENQEEEEEEEAVSEEDMGGEFLDTQNPEGALSELERVLEPSSDEDAPEVSRLSATQEAPHACRPKGKRRRRRVLELAKPKTNWQVLKDRMGCTAWMSPCKMTLQFSLYWPSVYWTERFLEDTTLSVTVPAVSPRVEELSRPKRFYLEYYNNNRTTPIWSIPRPTLEYQPSSRLKELATPKVRNNIWSINMSEVSQVSKAAQMAVPSSRILRLAKPRAPATLLEEWDPMPKPKPHVSNYNRLLHLAMPKLQSDQCVPDRDPCWQVPDVTKKAVASPRIVSLARPKQRKDLNEGYDPYHISPAALVARASPRLFELATPKIITKKCDGPLPRDSQTPTPSPQ